MADPKQFASVMICIFACFFIPFFCLLVHVCVSEMFIYLFSSSLKDNRNNITGLYVQKLWTGISRKFMQWCIYSKLWVTGTMEIFFSESQHGKIISFSYFKYWAQACPQNLNLCHKNVNKNCYCWRDSSRKIVTLFLFWKLYTEVSKQFI